MSNNSDALNGEGIFPDNFLENQLLHRPLCINEDGDDFLSTRGTQGSRHSSSDRRRRSSGNLGLIIGFVEDSWTLEYCALLLASTSLASIFITLGQNNGRLLIDWHHSFSINPILAVLATVMKAATLLAVAAAMAQLKWTWYHQQKRSLQDFQVFDSASRGPLGAAWLLCRVRFLHMGIIGAAITIIALASDTFVQMSVSFPVRSISSAETVSILVAHNYSLAGDVGSSMEAAIYSGVFQSNPDTLRSQLVAECTTGNCTIPLYATMAVCSECRNLTSSLSIRDNVTEWGEGVYSATLGLIDLEDLELEAGNGMMSFMNITAASFSSSTDAQANLSIANVSMVMFDGSSSRNTNYGSGTPSRFRAFNCDLSLCMKTYTASVSNGVLTETMNGSQSSYWINCHDTADCPYDNGSFSTLVPSFLSGPNSTDAISISANALTSLSTYLAGFRGEGGLLNGHGFTTPFQDPVGTLSWTNDIIHNIWTNGVDNVDRTFSNIAASMTNSLRTTAANTATGTAESLESYIHVRWPWMALPTVMVVAAIILVLFVSWRSWRWGIPSWRTSALASMLHGMHVDEIHEKENEKGGTGAAAVAETAAERGRGGWGRIIWGAVGGTGDMGDGKENLSELQDWAEGIKVRLRRRGETGREFGLVESIPYGKR